MSVNLDLSVVREYIPRYEPYSEIAQGIVRRTAKLSRRGIWGNRGRVVFVKARSYGL